MSVLVKKSTDLDLRAIVGSLPADVRERKISPETLPSISPNVSIRQRVARCLKQQGIHVNVTDGSNKTLLMHACILNIPSVVASLISLRADVTLRDNERATALAQACFLYNPPQDTNKSSSWLFSKRECIQILIHRGASASETLHRLCLNHPAYTDSTRQSFNEDLVLIHLTNYALIPLHPSEKVQKTQVRRFIKEEFPQRKLGGHINELANTATFCYEGWVAPQTVNHITQLEAFLPEDLRGQPGVKLAVETPILIFGKCFGGAVPEDTLTQAVKYIQNLQPLIIMCGWLEHSIALVFYKNFLAICNRGEKMPANKSMKVCTIHPEYFTIAEARRIVSLTLMNASKAFPEYYEILPKTLSATSDEVCRKVEKLFSKPHPFGHCSCASLCEAKKFLVLMSHVPTDGRFSNKTAQRASQLATSLEVNRRFLFLQRYLESHQRPSDAAFFDQTLFSHALLSVHKMRDDSLPFFSVSSYPLVERKLGR